MPIQRPPLFLLLFPLAFAVMPALASQADALSISRNIQEKHLPWGTVVDPVYASPGSSQLVAYTRCGDSVIWTGHYLAAESYRYKVTGDAGALANVRSAIAGLQSLVDITGTDLLARCRFPTDSPYARSIIDEEQHNGIYVNASNGFSWVGNTSRDQYMGIFFGLAVAWDMTSDAEVQASVSALVTRLLDFLLAHNWVVVMPNGSISTTFAIRPDQELSLLQVGRHVNPAKYSALWDSNVEQLKSLVALPIGLEVLSNSSYFKFNLDYIALFNLIRLEDSAGRIPEFQSAYFLLRAHTISHQNAFFNMIDRALNGPDAARDAETVDLLNAWLERPARDKYVDLRGSLPSCGSPDEACGPVPVGLRPTTDFLWQRDPFLLDGGGQGTVESAGIDYILPFWMARAYGVQDASAVVSAASGDITTMAPASIATFYGAGLANGVSEASSLPLPAIMNGVQMQFTDSAGAQRFALLYYVSPGQINFEVPEGVAMGRATVSVLNRGSVVASTTGSVQATSPGIFAGVAGAGTPAYVTLYGTGIRAGIGVTARIGSVSAAVLYSGPQGTDVGLDQVNIAVPAGVGSGVSVPVVVTVNGAESNPVNVSIP